MSSNVSQNLEFKCRVCLIENEKEFYSLFSKNTVSKTSLTNADLIMKCSSVQILENDGLPQNVCTKCCHKLSDFYEFQRLCESSDQLLQKMKIKTEIDKYESDCYDETVPFECESPAEENYKTCCSKDFNASDYLSHIKSHYLTNFKTRISKRLEAKLKHCEGADLKVDHSKRILNVTFPCPVCKKEFQSGGVLKSHHRKHICPYCPKIVKNIDYHLNVSHRLEEDPHQKSTTKCPICNKHYINLELHHHASHDKSNKCPTCSKVFSKYRFFFKHMRGYDTQSICSKGTQHQHLCPYCGRSFKEQGNLTSHIRIHTGEKPYVCEFCKKGFAQWSSLRSHRVIHTGEKNYACEVCGKAFSRLITLRKHLVSHSSEAKFPCEICGRKFKHSRSVKEHMVIHTGVKNFICEYCNKAFGFKKNLVVHRRMHTGDKPFKCEFCSHAFSQRHCLRSHINTHHKSEINSK